MVLSIFIRILAGITAIGAIATGVYATSNIRGDLGTLLCCICIWFGLFIGLLELIFEHFNKKNNSTTLPLFIRILSVILFIAAIITGIAGQKELGYRMGDFVQALCIWFSLMIAIIELIFEKLNKNASDESNKNISPESEPHKIPNIAIPLLAIILAGIGFIFNFLPRSSLGILSIIFSIPALILAIIDLKKTHQNEVISIVTLILSSISIYSPRILSYYY